MKKVLLSLAFMFSTFLPQAQNASLLWAKSVGGTGSDIENSIVVDASGNVYATGSFEGTVDFDPSPGNFTLTSSGLADIFLLKLDVSGNFVWAKQMGGSKNDYGHSVSVDGTGNVYSTGMFQDTADFDPGVGVFNLNSQGNNMFISKLDASGNLVYAKGMVGSGVAVGKAIAIDASNNVYATGHFQNVIDCDPGPGTFNLTSSGWDDILILKLDTSGNFAWAKSMGAGVFDNGQSLALDVSGNVYTAGTFKGTVDFNPGAAVFNLTSTTNGDVFISKLDASGNFIWAKSMGGTGVENCYGITIDASGNIYHTGRYTGMMDFDPSAGVFNLTSTGSYDIYISKLDPSGNFVFAKSMGGAGNDVGYALVVDATGNIYSTGFYNGTSDFDPSASTYSLYSSGSSVFISKLDVSGNFVWAESIGGTGSLGRAIAIGSSGTVYTAGMFSGTADFDPGATAFNLVSTGGNDIFIQKMAPASLTGIDESEIKKEEYIIYPNPNNGTFSFKINQEIVNGELVLINSIGQKVSTQKIALGGNYVITNELLNGLYYYIITQNNQPINRGKFIIKK